MLLMLEISKDLIFTLSFLLGLAVALMIILYHLWEKS